MTRNRSIAVLTVLLVGVGGTLWAMREDPQVAKVEQLREELSDSEDLSRDERRQRYGQLREEISKLSPEQREAYFNSMRTSMMQRMEERMDQFFALSPEEQQDALDEQIDRMERWRQRREQGNGNREQSGRGRGGPDRGRRGDGPRDPNEWRRRMLDSTSPELRAKFTEFSRLMSDRRKERGLPPGGFGRWR